MTPVLSPFSRTARPLPCLVVPVPLRFGDDVLGCEYGGCGIDATDRDELFGLRNRAIEENVTFLLPCEPSPLSDDTAEEGPDQLEGGVHAHLAGGDSGVEKGENCVCCEVAVVCVSIRDNDRSSGACMRESDGGNSSSLSNGSGGGGLDLLRERTEGLLVRATDLAVGKSLGMGNNPTGSLASHAGAWRVMWERVLSARVSGCSWVMVGGGEARVWFRWCFLPFFGMTFSGGGILGRPKNPSSTGNKDAGSSGT